MQLSLPPTTVSVSISLGERRSIHSSARPISLGLGVAGAGRSLYSQSTPYPSPPMSSSPPPDSLTPSRHSTQDASQERRHSVNPTASLLPALRHVETSPSLSSIGAGGHTAHDAQMTISSPVRRSPFVAQNTQLNQPQRRTKSHVASACVNCKKAHLACDVRRPCPRCVGLNKQDSCKDVQHKKRGRPRLRDERTHSFEVNQIGNVHNVAASSSPVLSPQSASTSYRAHMHRAIKSQSHHDHARITRNPTYNLRGPQTHQSGRYYDDRPSRNSFVGLPSPVGEVTTYLTTEFVFAKFTDSPTDLLGYKEHELYGVKGLFDIVSPTDRDKLYRLSRMILDEIQRKEPTYHYPPPANLYSAIQNASPAEVMSNLQNSREFPETLQLRLSTSHYRRFAVRIYVVKTSVFFVVARFSASEVPPLLQFQSPIDTYGTSTYIPPHSMTAPLTSPSFPGPSNSRHYAGDLPGPLSPYSLHASRAMQSPVDSRPRTLQTDSQQYPSLAQYSNASSTMSTALTQGPGRSPLSPHPTHPDPSLSFGRGSDNPDISNDLRLPPLRDIKTVEERGAPAAQLKAVENSRSETTRKRERIAVEEMLQ